MCSTPGCEVVFGLTDRKHHCRLCGDIVCSVHFGLRLRLRNSSDTVAAAASTSSGGGVTPGSASLHLSPTAHSGGAAGASSSSFSMLSASPVSMSSLSSLTSVTSTSTLLNNVTINPTTLPKTPTKGPSTIVVSDPKCGVLAPVCTTCYHSVAFVQPRGVARSRFELFQRRRKSRLKDLDDRGKEVSSALRSLMNAGATTKESQQAIVPWIPDSARTACNACGATFSLLNRRHHCRICGNLTCGKCMQTLSHSHPDDGVEDLLASFSQSASFSQRVLNPNRLSSIELPTCSICAHLLARMETMRAIERAQNTPILGLYAEMQFKQTELELLMVDWEQLATKVRTLTVKVAQAEERLKTSKARLEEAQVFAAAQTSPDNPNVTEELVEKTMLRVRNAVRHVEFAERELADLQAKLKPLMPEQERQKYMLTKTFCAFDDLSLQIARLETKSETEQRLCEAVRRAACTYLAQHKFSLVAKLVESRRSDLPSK